MHYAVYRSGPEEVVRLLLETYPDGAKAMNERGSLPLHHAAYRDAPMEVARLLLDAHPAGTKATTTVSYPYP